MRSVTEFSYYFEDFTAKMLKESYESFKKTDIETQEFESYLNTHKQRYEEILSTLNYEDKQFIINYISKQREMIENSHEAVYLAGYKDCVKLLKVIGVI